MMPQQAGPRRGSLLAAAVAIAGAAALSSHTEASRGVELFPYLVDERRHLIRAAASELCVAALDRGKHALNPAHVGMNGSVGSPLERRRGERGMLPVGFRFLADHVHSPTPGRALQICRHSIRRVLEFGHDGTENRYTIGRHVARLCNGNGLDNRLGCCRRAQRR